MRAVLSLTVLLAACATAPAPKTQPVTYACTGGIPTVWVTYSNPSTAVVTLQTEDGRPTRTLTSKRSASGARYDNATSNPPKPGTLVWWTKNARGILYLVVPAKPGQRYDYEKQLAVCNVAK